MAKALLINWCRRCYSPGASIHISDPIITALMTLLHKYQTKMNMSQSNPKSKYGKSKHLFTCKLRGKKKNLSSKRCYSFLWLLAIRGPRLQAYPHAYLKSKNTGNKINNARGDFSYTIIWFSRSKLDSM
jgi:hypothetical protein